MQYLFQSMRWGVQLHATLCTVVPQTALGCRGSGGLGKGTGGDMPNPPAECLQEFAVIYSTW